MVTPRGVPSLQVYSGQSLVGEIEDHGRGRVIAFRLDHPRRRIEVGTYPSRIAAMRAIATSTAKPPAAIPAHDRTSAG
jgi:hypothetical protein